MIPPIILAMYIFYQPESPRWLLAKAQKCRDNRQKRTYYKTVFQDVIRLRNSELLAARDVILMYYRLKKEQELRKQGNTPWYRRGIYELFSKRRNRNAVIASLIVMILQQFCGINVLIYYSSFVLQNHGYSASDALLVSSLLLVELKGEFDNCDSGQWALVSSIAPLLYQLSLLSTDLAGGICYL